MHRSRMIAVLSVVVILLAAAAVAVADQNRNYSVHLTGDQEVPARETNAQGQASFHLSKDGQTLHYKLNVANIENVLMAHIHMGPPSGTGGVVAWLYPSAPPGISIPGRTQGTLAEGDITAANLVGALSGQPLSALLDAMNNGNAYVNVHTNDFVDPPNTGAGDFPGGEIRGNLP